MYSARCDGASGIARNEGRPTPARVDDAVRNNVVALARRSAAERHCAQISNAGLRTLKPRRAPGWGARQRDCPAVCAEKAVVGEKVVERAACDRVVATRIDRRVSIKLHVEEGARAKVDILDFHDRAVRGNDANAGRGGLQLQAAKIPRSSDAVRNEAICAGGADEHVGGGGLIADDYGFGRQYRLQRVCGCVGARSDLNRCGVNIAIQRGDNVDCFLDRQERAARIVYQSGVAVRSIRADVISPISGKFFTTSSASRNYLN